MWLDFSPKSESLLQQVISKEIHFFGCPPKKKLLIDMCWTRSVEPIKAFAHFYTWLWRRTIKLTVQTSRTWAKIWEKIKARNVAQRHLNDFEFLVCFTTTYHILAIMECITHKLKHIHVDSCNSAYSVAIFKEGSCTLSFNIHTGKHCIWFNCHLLLQVNEVK